MAQSYAGISQCFGSVNKFIYEGIDSNNPLPFKHYNPEEVIGGK